MKKKLIVFLFLAFLFTAGGLVYFGQQKKRTAEIYYSGTIETTQSNLAFEVNGRVKEVIVDEGQKVKKNQKLALLDQEEFLARRARSMAELDQAVKKVKQLESLLELNKSVIPAEIEMAEAAVKGFRAQLSELEAGYRVQEVEQAHLTVQKAWAAMEEARKDRDRIGRLYREGIVSERDKDSADLKYETALKEYERAKESHKLYKEGFRKESIETAKSRLLESQAALKQARSNLKKIELTERELEVAKAQVQAARSALELAEIQLNHTILKAPFDGIIVSRNIEPGEVVSPSREILSLADLSNVELKIFVDETEIGKVKPGQSVHVKIDTFPQKKYRGTVSFISPEAEFTPKVIQTHKERVKLVYLVKVTIPNPDLELKPGMPADAWLK